MIYHYTATAKIFQLPWSWGKHF